MRTKPTTSLRSFARKTAEWRPGARSVPLSLLCLAIAALEPPSAAAAINTGDSIEWLCECMPHVGVVEVVLRGNAPPSANARVLRLPIGRTTKALKGSPPHQAAIDCFGGVHLNPEGRASLLAFFDEALQVKYAIGLDDSESCEAAITADFRVLHGRRAILAAAERRLKRIRDERTAVASGPHPSPSAPRYLTVPVPDGTPAEVVLFSGSIVFLNIPADSEYRSALLRNLGSENTWARAGSALYLGDYPGDETVAALEKLLADGGMDTLVSQGSDSTSRATIVYYPVRQAAYLALHKLGVDVPKPGGYVDQDVIEIAIHLSTAGWPTLRR